MRRSSLSLAAGLALLGLPLVIVSAGACKDERRGFEGSTESFTDAAAEASGCSYKCSLDGRSVVMVCSDQSDKAEEIVQTCSADEACGAGSCQAPCAAAAADRSSNGCEFYMQPPRFTRERPQSCYAAFVVNTSSTPVELTLSLGDRELDISKSVYSTKPGEATLVPHSGAIAPGESAILFISDRDPHGPPPGGPLAKEALACPEGIVAASLVDTIPANTGIGTSYHLTANVPLSAATIYPFGGAPSYVPSATLLLPVATWGKEHMLVNGWEAQNSRVYQAWPGAQIMASEETDVTILPNHDIQDGPGVIGTTARIPATYHLQKGQYLQLVQADELTGSIVNSTKPTLSVGGHSCANVPSSQAACEILGQQIPAFEQWGSEYVGVGYRPRLGNEHEPMVYRIVAARAGTTLDYDPVIPPGAPTSMSAGEIATFYYGTSDAFVVRTQDVEHPIYVAAYMIGGGPSRGTEPAPGNVDNGGRGDPEMVNVIPAGQYMNSYSFFADPTYSDTSLVVVRAKAGGNYEDVWLECAGNIGGFKPIGTRGQYEYARVDLARDGAPGEKFGASVCRNGLQRMRSEGPFTATLWGWDRYASYAYPGGMAQRKLVATPLAPIR